MISRSEEVLFIVAPEGFRDEEYSDTRESLEGRGFDLHVASVEKGTCIGRFGTIVEADLSLSDAMSTEWDAVIFVGGKGAQVYFDDEDAYELARGPVMRGGITAAICIAPTILSRAGLLGGAIATSFPTEQNELMQNGVKWTGGPLEASYVPGTGAWLITANGPEAASAFGKKIAETIEGERATKG